jgi:inosose dehydratase
MKENRSRRNFIKLTGLSVALGSLVGVPESFAEKLIYPDKADRRAKLNLGIASYSLRNFSLTETISIIKRLGLKRISLKEIHLPMDSSKESILKAAGEIKEAGLELYTAGVIYMTTEAEVARAFEYAKTASLNMIVGVPDYSLLELCHQKVKEYDIKLAIHNHGPNDKHYPGPADVYNRIKNMDKRVGMCLDIGHTIRLGMDPSLAVEKYFSKILEIHIKDETIATVEGTPVEMGRGVIDLPKFFKTLLEMNYRGTCAFEYEKDKNDPVPGLAESIGYVKGLLSVL